MKSSLELELPVATTTEHATDRFHRYVIAGELARDRRVLVYGDRDPALVAWLARHAQAVTTLELDPFVTDFESPEAEGAVDLIVAYAGVDDILSFRSFIAACRAALGEDGMLCIAVRRRAALERIESAVASAFARVARLEQHVATASLLLPPDAEIVAEALFVRSGDIVRSGGATAPAAGHIVIGGPADAAFPAASLFLDADARDGSPLAEQPPEGDDRSARRQLVFRERQLRALSDQVVRTAAHIHHVEQVAHQRHLDLEAAQRRADEVSRQLADAQRQAAAMVAEIARLRALVEENANRTDALAGPGGADPAPSEQAARAAAAEQHARELSAQLEELLQSHSWRLTKPLRIFMRRVRGGRRETSDGE